MQTHTIPTSGPDKRTRKKCPLHAHVDKLARHKSPGKMWDWMKYKRASFVWPRWKFTQFHQGN